VRYTLGARVKLEEEPTLQSRFVMGLEAV